MKEHMIEYRCAIEFREDASRRSPGRIFGRLLRYGEQAKDRAELFEADALRWNSIDGILLNRQHDPDRPIMRVQPEKRGDEIVIDAPLPNTRMGREIAVEVRGGVLTGLSVEFKAVQQEVRAGVRHIKEALLVGAGLVTSPSYNAPVEVRKAKHLRFMLLDIA